MKQLPNGPGWMGDPRRGASLGRRDNPAADPEQTLKFTLQRVRLDSGGYDSGGAYWGIGEPLYWASAEQEGAEVSFYFRATDRDSAKAEVLSRHPGARFFR